MSVNYNGTNYYYAANIQGDIMAILDTAGNAVVEYNYDAWGNIHSVTGSLANTIGETNPLTYRGYVYDHDSGYYYLQSRYYDPEIGRFINADVFASTGQGLLGNNMFSYCNNNPLIFADPTGEFGILSGLAIAGIAVSAVIGGVVAGVSTAMSGGSIGEIVASSAIGAVTAGGIAATAAICTTASTVALVSAAIGAGGEMVSIATEHGFHQNDPGYSFNWTSAAVRTAYAAGIGSLAGVLSYGINSTFTGSDELIGLAISAEAGMALGAVDFGARQIISSTTTPQKKNASTSSVRRAPSAMANNNLAFAW